MGMPASINLDRMPPDVRARIKSAYAIHTANGRSLRENSFYTGDARTLMPLITPNSVSLSVWSPPYYVGKAYESYLTYEGWRCLIQKVIRLHFDVLQPGGFLAINIADILCFRDSQMPRIQADLVSRKKSPGHTRRRAGRHVETSGTQTSPACESARMQ